MPLFPPPSAGRIPAYTKAIDTSGNKTNTTATPVLLPTVTVVCTGADVLLQVFCIVTHSAATAAMVFNPRLDGSIPASLSNPRVMHTPNVGGASMLPVLSWVFAAPAAGSHTFGFDFSSSTGGTQTIGATAAQPFIVYAQELLT